VKTESVTIFHHVPSYTHFKWPLLDKFFEKESKALLLKNPPVKLGLLFHRFLSRGKKKRKN